MNSNLINHQYTKLAAIFGLYIFGPLFFMFTDPNALALPLLILPFIWLFAVIYMSAHLILKFKTKATKKQSQIISSLSASLVVLLCVFQSIHQLSIRDVAISVAIIGIAALYLLRADFIK